MKRKTPTICRRRGFTLLELLIVIGIIALLAGISFTIIGGMIDSANRAATQATLAKVNGLLQQQVSGYYRNLNPDHRETKTLAGNFFFPGGTYPLTNDRDASIVLATKNGLQRALPQNIYEIFGFDRKLGGGDDLPLFTNWAADNTISNADSSELLYLALTQGKVQGASPVDRSVFNESELGDTDNDKQPEIIDAWGQPLRFYRWPTRLVNPYGYIANVVSEPSLAINDTGNIQLQSASEFTAAMLPTPFYVVVEQEIIKISSISGNRLIIATDGRGALSTNPAEHPRSSRVKLAPYADIATLLLGFVSTDALTQDADDRYGAVAEVQPYNGAAPGEPLHLRPLANPPFEGDPRAWRDYELLFHTLDSYHAPLVVSAGADGVLGLLEPGPVVPDSGNPHLPDPAAPQNILNIWVQGSDLNGTGTIEDARWGTLAQPDVTTYPTILTNPGSSPLADNLTNYNSGT